MPQPYFCARCSPRRQPESHIALSDTTRNGNQGIPTCKPSYTTDQARRICRGVDTAIEAVGIPATFNLCEDIVAPGGTIANVGVHGVKVDLHLEKLWSHNIAITTGLVDTFSIPLLLKTVQSKRIDTTKLITHHFTLAQILDAYDTFGRAADTKALKVIIEA